MKKEVRDCFVLAVKDEKKGKKHNGLLITKPDNKIAEGYIQKAKVNLKNLVGEYILISYFCSIIKSLNLLLNSEKIIFCFFSFSFSRDLYLLSWYLKLSSSSLSSAFSSSNLS